MNHYEIEACVIRAKNGNKAELLKLLEQFKPFIFKNAACYNIKNYDLYDLVQIGYVSLINAVAKYRTGSNTFSSYAYNTVKNKFRNTARNNIRNNTELSLNSPLNANEDPTSEFIDYIEAPGNLEDDILSASEIRVLKKAVSKLPSDEMELIIMIYYSGMSLRAYSKKTGLSYQQTVNKKNRILKKLSKCVIR